MNDDVFLEVQGKTDDLLQVSQDGTMIMTNLVYLGEDIMDPKSEVMNITVCSTNEFGEHPIFEKMLGKKISVKISIVE